MLRVKKYNSIHEINPIRWDSILKKEDIFHTYEFVRTIEDSKVENARFSYLLFYENEKLVATTVLSAFVVNLTLFIGNSRLANLASCWFPKLFKIKILVCGLPASFGQQNLKLENPKYANEVCTLLAAEMKAMAKQWRIPFLTIKEFKKHELLLFTCFQHQGFFAAHSIPYMKMQIRWKSFDNYLQSLRHHYRRQILSTLKKTGQKQPLILSPEEYDSRSSSPAWVLSDSNKQDADAFYQNYLNVMQRSTTKLETLNQAFFQHLFRNKQYKILSLMVKGKAISSALLLPAGNTLTWVLVAREKEKDEYNSYRNLLYGILAYAIKGGYQSLHLGQTAYWTKQCLGAEAENEFFWFCALNKFRHWTLKRLSPVLFPRIELNKVTVFKEERSKLTLVPKPMKETKIR